MNKNNKLLAISPIDGRYSESVEELIYYSSEFGIIKNRIEIEINYLIKLSESNIIRRFTQKEITILENIYLNFNLEDAEKIKKIEDKTRHDVKAIEYYLKDRLTKSALNDVLEFIHFGLTTWDINNISERIMLKAAIENVILQNLKKLNNEILRQTQLYKDLTILGRTHGQAAIPTTLGKELNVFKLRLDKEINILEDIKFYGKLNGAIGNYNAFYFTYPNINWGKFSKEFLASFNLKQNESTNQIAPYEDIIFAFQTIQRINNILLNFNQDMWRYISDNWLVQENKKEEIGSSTMPQKINPIMFENSEGNIIIANSLIEGFISKLAISRLQRDLSGSTIVRNFGMALAYSLLAYKNCYSGLIRVKANKTKILEDLNFDWSILSEAVQIYLKKTGVKNSYEIIKDFTRGEKMKKEDYLNMIEKLPLNNDQKIELKKLTPETYIGKTY